MTSASYDHENDITVAKMRDTRAINCKWFLFDLLLSSLRTGFLSMGIKTFIFVED